MRKRKYSKNAYELSQVIQFFATDKTISVRRVREPQNDFVYLVKFNYEDEGFKLVKTLHVEAPDDFYKQMGVQGLTKEDFEAEWFVEWSPQYAVHDQLVIVYQSVQTGNIYSFSQSEMTLEQIKSQYKGENIISVHSINQETGELERL